MLGLSLKPHPRRGQSPLRLRNVDINWILTLWCYAHTLLRGIFLLFLGWFFSTGANTSFINTHYILTAMHKKRFDTGRGSFNSGTFESNFGSKKAQVTVFIILGIVLLLAAVLVILLRTEIITIQPRELVQTEKGRVESFITSCLEQLGTEAVNKIGLQAGYINVPPETAADGNLHLRLSPMTVAPYWAYGLTTNIPSLDLIKQRIDQHIEENLRSCLLGTEAFLTIYNLEEKSELRANTEIGENKVIFNAVWDVEISTKSGEVIAEVINHFAESPIKLKRVHETAKLVVEREMSTLKLEDIAQDLIALEHPDVPVAGVDLSCAKREWNVNKVKRTLQELLRINIRALKVKGTDYVEFPEELTYYQNHYIWDVGEEFKQPEVEVRFNYDPTYPFAFGVTPLRGSRMRSEQLGGSSLLSFLCLQTWKFTYDLTFPVLIQVRDQTTGYVFNAPVTVHLFRNIPNRAAVPTARPSYFVETVTDEDYCRNQRIPMTVFTYELVENERTGVYNREPLDHVNTSFTCLRYRCDLGQTIYDFSGRGDIAGYRKFFPYCIGGILRAQKGGYREEWLRVVTREEAEVELNLVPLFSFPAEKIKFFKHEWSNDGKVGPVQPLSQNDVVSLKITYIKLNQTEPFQESSMAYAPRLGEDSLRGQSLDFLAKTDFTYQLNLNLIRNEKLIGGYKQNWSVSWEQLEKAKEIDFHLLSKPVMSEEETYHFVQEIEKNSALVPGPEVK